MRLYVFDPDLLAVGLLDAHPRLAALGVRHAVNAPLVAGVLGQFRRARAGRRVDEIKMDKAAIAPVACHHALERDLVILPPRQPAAEARLQHRVGKRHFQPRGLAVDLAQVGLQDLSHPFSGDDAVLVLVK